MYVTATAPVVDVALISACSRGHQGRVAHRTGREVGAGTDTRGTKVGTAGDTPQRRRPGRAGRRQRVEGGYPVVRQIALTMNDGERLAVLATLAGMSQGAYAAHVVEQHLRARWEGELPMGAREALGVLVARSADIVGLAQEVAAIGRLFNQVARHVHVHGTLPPGSSLARIEREFNLARMKVAGTLAGLDEAAAALRERL